MWYYLNFQFDDLEHGLHRIHSEKVNTSLLIYFFGQKEDGQLGFEDFRKFMDNLQTEVSNWKNTLPFIGTITSLYISNDKKSWNKNLH